MDGKLFSEMSLAELDESEEYHLELLAMPDTTEGGAAIIQNALSAIGVEREARRGK